MTPANGADSGWISVEPFIGGNITGPTLNAVIQGGLAFPTLEENGTVQNVNIALYGVTTDGYSFYASGTGVGSSGNQFAEFVSNPVRDVGGWFWWIIWFWPRFES